jgi:hypothetical protein
MHEDVGRYVGSATSGLVQPEHLQTTRNREKRIVGAKNSPR